MSINKSTYRLLLTTLALSFVLQSKAQSTVDSNYIFSGYTDRLALFNSMPISKGAIIFLGNSLTEAGRWKEIAPELPILNRGISGDISFGVYARLDEVIRHQPQKIFLMIGVNDLKREIPTTYIIHNYQRIVDRIQQKAPKTKIYLNSMLPINNQKLLESFKSVKNEDVRLLNVALRQLAEGRKGVTFVDLHTVVADRMGELRADMTPDGIHLDVSAYVDVIQYLKNIKAL